MSYALWVDRVIGDFRAEQIAMVVAAGFGAKPEVTTLDGRLAQFVAALSTPPPQLDSDERELRAALGLRHG